jgi:hypothetical protein
MCIFGSTFNPSTCQCEPIKTCSKDLCLDGSARDPLKNCSCPTCATV